jgi:adenosylcobinamide kinase/adenosylcobinamide-phosphate guanylyltransferase
MAVLVTGGARSGKSRFAERYAATLGTRGLYIATMQGLDDEMRERIELHRLRREESGFSWRTVEEPLELAQLLLQHADSAADRAGEVILVDCLTLWLSNWLLELEGAPDAVEVLDRNIDELAEALASVRKPVIAVTNEVGDGVVPEYPLGRRFRDFAGVMNQRVAEVCEEVFLVTAGIPVELKKIAFTFGKGNEPQSR